MGVEPIRYAESDGLQIAYQVVGSGPVDVVYVPGSANHIEARVAATAAAGEVLVSSTVKDLVVGSGMAFAGRGAHTLKGVPGEWQLYATGA